jgi:succinate dehydrogenase / fumarate reductase flavoprotein subunit
MQGLADGYFVIPYTIGAYLSKEISVKAISTDHEAFVAAENEVKSIIDKLFAIKGTKSVDHFHKALGKIMWEKCGMARNEKGLKEAIQEIRQLRDQFWKDVRVTGAADEFNPELEKAGRVADFLELGELMCIDALHRNESCGGHFREEYQTSEGEALRDDVNFAYVAAWENKGNHTYELHKEELKFEAIKIAARSYK